MTFKIRIHTFAVWGLNCPFAVPMVIDARQSSTSRVRIWST